MTDPGKIQSKLYLAKLISEKPPAEILRLLTSQDIDQDIKELVALIILSDLEK